MKRDAFFAAADALPVARLSDLLGEGGAVIVAPHPDDESLGCGALILKVVAAGRPVRIVFVSDGARSHPNSRSYPAERLRTLREKEALAAAAALGVAASQIEFLRLPDGAVPVVRPRGGARFRHDRKRRRKSPRTRDFCDVAA